MIGDKYRVADLLGYHEEFPSTASTKSLAEALFTRWDSAKKAKLPKKDLHKLLQTEGVPKDHLKLLFSQTSVGLDQTISLAQFVTGVARYWRYVRRTAENRVTRPQLSANKPRRSLSMSRVFKADGMKHCYVWIRGNQVLNTRSNTNAFEMVVLRDSSLRAIYSTFQEIDIHANDHISLRDLKSYLAQNAPDLLPMATGIFNSLDPKRTSTASFRQVMRMIFPSASPTELQSMIDLSQPADQQRKNKCMDEETVEEISEVFRVYDDNGDGTLDLEEFTSAMSVCGFSQDTVETMFSLIDKDGNGSVSLVELLAWYSEHEPLKYADKDVVTCSALDLSARHDSA